MNFKCFFTIFFVVCDKQPLTHSLECGVLVEILWVLIWADYRSHTWIWLTYQSWYLSCIVHLVAL